MVAFLTKTLSLAPLVELAIAHYCRQPQTPIPLLWSVFQQERERVLSYPRLSRLQTRTPRWPRMSDGALYWPGWSTPFQ